MQIKFGKLKQEIKSDFYLGGDARWVENKTLDIDTIGDGWVDAWDGYSYRHINLNHFEEYEITVQPGDVRNYEEWDLPQIDLLIGGSPCQDRSIAEIQTQIFPA